MNTIAAALGGLLMLGAAIVPVVLAHGDSGAHDSLVALPWLGSPGPASTDTQPSGWYYGSASAWAQLNSFSAASVGPGLAPGCPSATGNAPLDRFLCGLRANLDPSLALASPRALCDLEVTGDGTAEEPGDETVVDGTPASGTLPFAALAPDGTFNDGGVGGVCHEPAGFYAHASYNTNGCDPSQTAVAEDAAFNDAVWITTACDSLTNMGDPAFLPLQVLSTAVCAANVALSGDVLGARGCATAFLACQLDGYGSPSCPTSAWACGADGIVDASNSGTGQGVPYPGIGAGCGGGTVASETAFVWDSVQVTVASDGSVIPDNVSAATYGWIQ